MPVHRYVLYAPDFDPIFPTVCRDDSPRFHLWSDPLILVWMWGPATTFLHGVFPYFRELHIIQWAIMQSVIFHFSFLSHGTTRPAKTWSETGWFDHVGSFTGDDEYRPLLYTLLVLVDVSLLSRQFSDVPRPLDFQVRP